VFLNPPGYEEEMRSIKELFVILSDSEGSSSTVKVTIQSEEDVHDKNGCHAELVEAWWARPLRATLRQAQGDRPFLSFHL
jgi:hypothetical protein